MKDAQETPTIDVWERTKGFGGAPVQAMNRRLFMQLLSYECEDGLDPERAIGALGAALDERGASAVIYADVNNPRGLAIVSWSEEPGDFVKRVRPALSQSSLRGLRSLPAFTMLGRSYSTGYEPDLEYWLIRRPIETVRNGDWPWAVWYPLRRAGSFEMLEEREKGGVLREHAEIGKAYGQQNLAHDVRLACHGLDANDNEFVIGLIGPELHPLSHVVQAMRKTRQTSQFIVHMGPFFVGHRAWISAAQ
ncbi:MAG TPA: chlorite dismutase family protein [Polyangiaceae bacterium]|nr:chlorite dismutase family protein [Polyangiaceae bacterium]